MNEHEWTYVEFVYGAWTECTCGYRPESEAAFEGHSSDHSMSAVEWNRCDCTGYTPAQAAQDRPRRDDAPSGGGADGQDASDATQARQRAFRATTIGGHAGIAEGLAAIAHALLAQEQDR